MAIDVSHGRIGNVLLRLRLQKGLSMRKVQQQAGALHLAKVEFDQICPTIRLVTELLHCYDAFLALDHKALDLYGLGEQLKKLRLARGQTYRDVYVACGYAEPDLCLLENGLKSKNGYRNIRFDTLALLARHYGVPLEVITKGD